MSSLAFGTPFIARAWRTFSASAERGDGRTRRKMNAKISGAFGSRSAHAASSTHTPFPNARWMTALGVFASAYGTFLLTGDDEEFAKKDKPLPVTETPASQNAPRRALARALGRGGRLRFGFRVANQRV